MNKEELLSRLKRFRSPSEFIVEDGDPDYIFQIDWKNTLNIHPFRFGDYLLKEIRKAKVPVYGEVDVEGVTSGRLFWDDYIDIGCRTYFYWKNDPKYIPKIKEYNICKLVCPICKEPCGGVSNHLEETADILPPEKQFHGCLHQHKWLSIPKGKKISYKPADGLIVSSVEYSIDEQTFEVVERSITFDE